MDPLSATQRANIEYHTLLAPQYEQQPFFQEANRKRVRAQLRELAKNTSCKRLLDIGCGTGLILDLAHDLFKELDGIDITPEMLARVKPRANVRTQRASAEKIPFPNKTFDVITAYSMLHHIEDLSLVFREVRRTLKPGGFFYADESPSEDYLDAFLALDPSSPMSDAVLREREKITSDAAEYQRKYGFSAELAQRAMVQNYSCHSLKQENLERLLKSSGFDIVQITFRRFVGEDQCREKGGEEMVHALHSYLVSMLPLTRSLFKYFVLVAR
jgi:ubiquinone/menaquinone biosynthesis C-methylase UbiE